MKLAILGSTGMMGKAVLAAAIARGHDVTIVTGGPVGVFRNVIERKADVMAGVPDWIPPFRAAGVDVAVMQIGRFFPNMAQAILASDVRIRQRPAAIGAFVRGTLRGLREVMSNPAEAARLLVATYADAYKNDPQAARETIDYYVRYVYPGQRILGEVNEARLAELQEFYVGQGIIGSPTPLRDLYTNQFVLR